MAPPAADLTKTKGRSGSTTVTGSVPACSSGSEKGRGTRWAPLPHDLLCLLDKPPLPGNQLCHSHIWSKSGGIDGCVIDGIPLVSVGATDMTITPDSQGDREIVVVVTSFGLIVFDDPTQLLLELT
jgi:hypothetical protein